MQSDLGIDSPVEDGKSFVENALIKARYAAEKSGLMAIADDLGLCVDALGGAPGIYSARYAGEHGDDNANNKKLLEELKKHRNIEEESCPLFLRFSFNEKW